MTNRSVTAADGHFDHPADVARRIIAAERPVLIGLDVDGVLAPIVDHASDAALLAEFGPLLVELASLTPVVIVSGRSMHDLTEQFSFPTTIDVYGSHGLERRDVAPSALDGGEVERLAQLRALAERAAAMAGPGAWVEYKPKSVVLHVRQASDGASDQAMAWLRGEAVGVAHCLVKDGQSVVELLVREASKATAVAESRTRSKAFSVVFVGDDLTDEEVMRSLGPGDVAVRVGDGDTVASHRLRDPLDVVELLREIIAGLAA